MKLTEIYPPSFYPQETEKRDYSHIANRSAVIFVISITRDLEKSNPPEKGGLLFSFFCLYKTRVRYATTRLPALDNAGNY